MRIQYQILFSIEILHHYFASLKWKEIDIVPLPETVRLFQQSGLLVRHVQNQLLVIVPVDKDQRPFRLPDSTGKFSFTLQPQTPGYTNFTNLPFAASGLAAFCMDNLHGATVGGVNYLTRELEAYAAATAYVPGDLVLGAGDKVYESIRLNNGVQAPDNSNPASKVYWDLHGDDRFVSLRDAMLTEGGAQFPFMCTRQILTLKVTQKKTFHQLVVSCFNPLTDLFDTPVRSLSVRSDAPSDVVQVDFGGLESGRYCVKTGGNAFYVYVANGFSQELPRYVIDIFHTPAGSPKSLLNPDGTTKNLKFTIRFGSRRVYWRYKTRTNTINKIEDSSGDYKFKPDGLRQFISERPIPLTEAPRKTLTANTGNVVVTSPLPNPRVDRLLDKKDEIFTTETFINY
jgi:hypothetical protein